MLFNYALEMTPYKGEYDLSQVSNSKAPKVVWAETLTIPLLDHSNNSLDGLYNHCSIHLLHYNQNGPF